MKSYHKIRPALLSGESTCRQIVAGFLQVIERKKQLNAYLEVWADEALERASQIDEQIKAGKAGKLAGMVIAIKDNIVYKGHKVSASSKILDGFESLFSATALERLEAEGAIFIGRTNCDEFAMGSSNENSAFGNVLNPVQEDKVPGGSSGGSAVAAAAELCHVALGSDTGGSIRQPASFCGVVGVKPTYGRVSRSGLIAYGSSFDQIGPLALDLNDAALVLEIISGKDPKDNTSSSKEVPALANLEKVESPMRIAYIQDCLDMPGLDAEIKEKFLAKLELLKQAGHTVEPVSFPYLDYMVPTYYVLTTAEASSNLARYDGVHFGYRADDVAGLESTYKKTRTEGFGPEVKRRIMLGTFVLSSGFYDAYYGRAQRVRKVLQTETDKIFQDFDLLLTPTTPTTAFPIDDKAHHEDPTVMYLEDIFTVHANLTGCPAVSIPLDQHSNGLPYGIQIMAARFEEKSMLQLAATIVD